MAAVVTSVVVAPMPSEAEAAVAAMQVAVMSATTPQATAASARSQRCRPDTRSHMPSSARRRPFCFATGAPL